jgi:hypothetical protein
MAMYNKVKQECVLNNPQVMGIKDICTATTDDFNSVQQCVEKKFAPEIVSTVLFFEYPTQLSVGSQNMSLSRRSHSLRSIVSHCL